MLPPKSKGEKGQKNLFFLWQNNIFPTLSRPPKSANFPGFPQGKDGSPPTVRAGGGEKNIAFRHQTEKRYFFAPTVTSPSAGSHLHQTFSSSPPEVFDLLASTIYPHSIQMSPRPPPRLVFSRIPNSIFFLCRMYKGNSKSRRHPAQGREKKDSSP